MKRINATSPRIATWASIASIASLVGAPLLAQEPGTPAAQDPTRPASPRPESAAPAFLSIELGERAVVNDAAGQTLGSIAEYVIDRKSGAVRSIALHLTDTQGGELQVMTVLVPYADFVWKPKQRDFVLDSTPEELRSLPRYEPDKLGVKGGVADAGGEKGDRGVRDAQAEVPTQCVASKLLDSRVNGTTDEIAKVSGLALDARRGTLAFILARAEPGADPYVIPWTATAWKPTRMTAPDDPAGAFVVPKSAEELEQAPRLAQGDLGALKKDLLAKVYAFYGVVPPVDTKLLKGKDKDKDKGAGRRDGGDRQ